MPDEPTHSSDDADVERYEQLRHVALGGDPFGGHLGLAVLEHKGVAAWLRLWPSTASRSAPRPLSASPADVDELVGVLASMALAILAVG